MKKEMHFNRKTWKQPHRKRQYALITGASSGIGREFAVQLARHGFPLILVARRRDRLEELAQELEQEYGCKSLVLAADLSEPRQVEALFATIEELPLGIVINNAGFGDCSSFLDGDVDKELDMIDVNIKAMHLVMKLALRKMEWQDTVEYGSRDLQHHPDGRSRRSCPFTAMNHRNYHGYILNVASSAGLMPAGPYMATYYATKAYVTSLTQGVAEELREAGSNLYVGCLCPGPVDTEFNERANVRFALPGMQAQRCVRIALREMGYGNSVIVPGLVMKAVVACAGMLPPQMLIRIVSRQQTKKF